MKKIIMIILAVIAVAVGMSILGSCGACNSCNSCKSCNSSCNSSSCSSCKKKNKPSTPPKPTEYFYLSLNDGTTERVPVDINSYSLGNSYISRVGYIFKGAFDSENGGTMYYDEHGYKVETPEKNMTLYCQWEIRIYRISFLVDVVEIDVRENISYNSYLADFIQPNTAPEGKEFEGWKDKKGTLVSDEYGKPDPERLAGEKYTLNETTIVLTASFRDICHKVTFDYGEYGANKEITVDHGQVIEELGAAPDLKKYDGYEFRGWAYGNNASTNKNFYVNEPVNEDLTLFAIVVRYKVIVLADANDKQLKTVRIYDDGSGVDLSKEELTLQKGYGVAGWYYDKAMSGGSHVSNSVVGFGSGYDTVYADIQPIKYTITLRLGAGVTCSAYSVEYTINDKITLPEASKSNSQFLGWCTDAALTSTPVKEFAKGKTGDFDLYPKFKGVNVMLTLNARGGSPSTTVQKEYGQEFTLIVPTRNGYRFLGWYNASSGGKKYTDDKGVGLAPLDVSVDTILYAQWEQEYKVSVTVTPTGVSTVAAQQHVEGERVTLTVTVPNGYTLDGWYRDEVRVSSQTTYSFNMPASDVDVTLKLTPKTYTVKFDCIGFNSALDGTTQQVTFGESFTLPKPEITGFKGWTYDGTTLLTDANGISIGKWNIAIDGEILLTPKQ